MERSHSSPVLRVYFDSFPGKKVRHCYFALSVTRPVKRGGTSVVSSVDVKTTFFEVV